MKRAVLISVMAALGCVGLHASNMDKAQWTGRFERVALYDHTQGINCQYHTTLTGNFFWQSFRGYSCPATIEVP
jgi:hypothetical protein